MLVLSRNVGEAVVVGRHGDGTEVRIVVISVDRKRREVRLGFEAPQDIPIVREELLEEKT